MKKRLLVLFTMVMLTLVPMSAYAEEEIVDTGISQTYDVKLNLPSKNYTGIVPGYDGNYYLVQKGKVLNYTGIYYDQVYGCWLIGNGVVCLNYNDFYNDPVVGWWKIKGGAVDFAYTGWYTSPTVGTWYVQGGQLDFSKGQGTVANTSTYVAPGYTYNTLSATVSNDEETRAFLYNALKVHAPYVTIDVTGGYTTAQIIGVLNDLFGNKSFEEDDYITYGFKQYDSTRNSRNARVNLYYWSSIEEEQALDEYAMYFNATLAGRSDAEKVQTIHDFICNVCEYDYNTMNGNGDNRSAYDCIVGKSAVCMGYAAAFQRMATAVGLNCKIISSEAENHSWNVVMVDGQWYTLDCTWDDQSTYISRKYYLKGADVRTYTGVSFTIAPVSYVY